jgi:hypothetical protein
MFAGPGMKIGSGPWRQTRSYHLKPAGSQL